MLNKLTSTTTVTHLIAMSIMIGLMWMLLQGQTIPDLLVGLSGMVVAHYFRRQTEDDVHTQSERVLGSQALVEDTRTHATT